MPCQAEFDRPLPLRQRGQQQALPLAATIVSAGGSTIPTTTTTTTTTTTSVEPSAGSRTITALPRPYRGLDSVDPPLLDLSAPADPDLSRDSTKHRICVTFLVALRDLLPGEELFVGKF